ncbi:MAG: deoxyuridine 5'-triphosphate nucleotidohydrolase [actinobacterium acAMD-5]|jgi:dUTP pyrophosphatase|nr:MAG: deoxyuridine 5'-triphosphate nucleotidohydrolase [actinobacterium acAMD-5]
MIVLVQKLVADVPLPSFAHPGDAGADLVSTVDLIIEPGERALVPTGISIALPENSVAYVMPRSGLAIKHGVTVLNAPGTIDSGYRGEIKVPLINLDPKNSFVINRLDRIAQLTVSTLADVRYEQTNELPDSARGAGGFGSTGVKS